MAAILTVGMGVINLISSITPALYNRFALIRTVLPLEVIHGSRLTSALAGFALFLLADSLWRRKRTGWVLTVILLVVSIVTQILKGLDFEEAILGIGLLILLLLLRDRFHAHTDLPSLRQGLQVLFTAFVFTLAYGAAGFYLLDRHFSTHFGLLDALRQTIVMFTSFYNPGLEPITGFGRYFALSIYVIGLTTLTYALFMLFRPVLVRLPATAEERRRAEVIVQQYGRTALARPALYADKSYFFSPGGSTVAYAVRGRGAMALGDPIGPESDAESVITAFRDFCARNDWVPAFVSILPDFLKAYQTAGFDILSIGQEAIVKLDTFSLEGSANKNVRNAVTKMERLGYRAEMCLPPLESKLVRALRAVSDEWLTMKHGGEMHFSDGWFDDEIICQSPVMAVHAPTGEIEAFATLLPEYRKNEMAVDLMRRRREMENGTMELLFCSLLSWAKEKGYATLSLGLGAGPDGSEGTDNLQLKQTLQRLSKYINRVVNYKGLYSYKEKFHPQWEPRYLAYPGIGSLPGVISTLLLVHTDDNFLRVSKFLRKKGLGSGLK